MASLNYLFFFFQAEDGIRDLTVTGVQTCALPISNSYDSAALTANGGAINPGANGAGIPLNGFGGNEIGRGSCRGRGEISVVAGSFKKKKKNTKRAVGAKASDRLHLPFLVRDMERP